MKEYLASFDGALTDPEAFEMHLVYAHAGDHDFPDTTETTTTTTTGDPGETSDDSPSIPYSTPMAIFLGIVAIPILRRKLK
jgi:hypothetical protein